MLEKWIVAIFVSKPQAELEANYLMRQAFICGAVGAIVLAISIPALQHILAQVESATLVEKIPGAVKPFGIAIMASGFYLLLRGLAHYYLYQSLNRK